MNDIRCSRARRALLLVSGLLVGAAPAYVACSSSGDTAAVKAPEGPRAESVKHEPCDESLGRVEKMDTNSDGKNDITRVYNKSSGIEICRVADLTFDGKPDLYEYFDASGQVRRREYAYEDTGAITSVETYKDGKLVERAYDTTGQHRIDTWDYFDPTKPVDAKTGRPVPVRRERDRTGDGRVDEWWVWDGQKITVSFDRNGDGKPDPGDTIVLNDPDAGSDDNGGQSAPADAGVADAPTVTVAPAPPPPIDAGTNDGGRAK
jgi:hypothetical protein